MARLEYIQFHPWRIDSQDGDPWSLDGRRKKVSGLPQIFWDDGTPWAEANLWALDNATSSGIKLRTVCTAFKHLRAYAEFVESSELDWRHFPTRRDERILTIFRGHLLSAVEEGSLKSSTVRARMQAVIAFYRYAQSHGLVETLAPLWKEKSVVVKFVDKAGFERAMTRVVTDLAIPNRERPGVRLEDGLLPLPGDAMQELLQYTLSHHIFELHLMLKVGFFTGARIGTITTLKRENLEGARPDPFSPGFYAIPIGPGTGVETKFDVSGNLLVHEQLLSELKAYAACETRLLRQIKASEERKTTLFLTRSGRPYSVGAVDTLVRLMRLQAVKHGLSFMTTFRFHQTRATFGTALMELLLPLVSAAEAIDFVRSSMHHKHESTTFRYLKFIQNTKGKVLLAQQFTELFSGLGSRQWN